MLPSAALVLPLSLSRYGIVVVGSANYDFTMYVKRLPLPGETRMGSSLESSCGGKGANQAVAAASLLPPEAVHILCKVGSRNDTFGNEILSNFQKTHVQYDKNTVYAEEETTTITGNAQIIVDETTGENQICVFPGANSKLTPQHVRDYFTSRLTPPAVVLVQLEIPRDTALEALKQGKRVGALTILNPAPISTDDLLVNEFYKYCDLIVPNEIELSSMVGEQCPGIDEKEEVLVKRAKCLLSKEGSITSAIIITRGSKGATIVEKQTESTTDIRDLVYTVQASHNLSFKDLPVVDTVGAGDAFCGALGAYFQCSSIAYNIPSNNNGDKILLTHSKLKEAAITACGIASMSVRKKGAQTSYPKLCELDKQLQIPFHISSDIFPRKKSSITFVTGNKKKLEEVKRILSTIPSSLILIDQKIDLPELQGDPEDIAIEKCKIAANIVGGAVLTEDTSLCFNALSGLPGVYIKWFLEKCGHDGLNDMLSGFVDKTAYAQTIVAYCPYPGGKVQTFTGKTDGKIVRPRGSLDFGWDPIFEPLEGGGKTYAEMAKHEKDSISHRSRAFDLFQRYLNQVTK